LLATAGLLAAVPAAAADQSPAITNYPVRTANGNPLGIASAPDESIWFTESAANKIGTVRAGVVVEYPIPTQNSNPERITTSNTGTIWFAEAAAPDAGTISTAGTIEQTPLPTVDGATAIATDTAGNIWLVQPASSHVVEPGVIQLAATGAYTVGESFLPQDIIAGPGNTLWLAEPKDNAIGRIDLTAPSITSSPTVTLTAGRASNVTLTTSAFPAPTLSEAGSPPHGVRFTDNGNGTATIAGRAPDADAGLRLPATRAKRARSSPS
jgi:streptogramin lyase